MITLYQFKFSHFCEKTRWNLDYKGLPFSVRNLLPGLHLKVTGKLAPKSSVPIIVDNGQVVQGSAQILNYLDEQYPEYSLTPDDPALAEEAQAWEQFVDEEIGPTLRLWFYYYALPDRKCALNFLLDGAPWYGRPLFAVIYPKVRAKMIDFMGINAETAAAAKDRFETALDRLDEALAGKRFLVGDQFSRADLAACALLSPYCAPGRSNREIDSVFPGPVRELREAHRERPFFKWVNAMYGEYRSPR
ncbi:MAG: glutathione S-transferase [Oceanospirillaceae bacterium]|nr:glutathione S-transferase [Oceanospirillaceae bacterium]